MRESYWLFVRRLSALYKGGPKPILRHAIHKLCRLSSDGASDWSIPVSPHSLFSFLYSGDP